MRYLLLLCLSSVSVAHADVIAFIGSPRAVAVSEKGCQEYVPREVICADRAFILTYDVLERLTAGSRGSVVEFVGFFHYPGLPDYTRYDPALVIVERFGRSLRLKRIEPLERIDGRWWVCEEWPESADGRCVRGRYVEEIVADVANGA
jgi:hypothetical protein